MKSAYTMVRHRAVYRMIDRAMDATMRFRGIPSHTISKVLAAVEYLSALEVLAIRGQAKAHDVALARAELAFRVGKLWRAMNPVVVGWDSSNDPALDFDMPLMGKGRV